jgi:hypothetical protein
MKRKYTKLVQFATTTFRTFHFVIYKFRTMTDERDIGGNVLSDAERLTRLGSFLRKTRLDELPELVNVDLRNRCFYGKMHHFPLPLPDAVPDDLISGKNKLDSGP